jgi:hypothetical protein
MKKNEFIWRHLLFECIEKRTIRFQQQELAALFGISTSTVNAALIPIRRIGGIRVGGRGFEIVDYEKILYHWANVRQLSKDIAFSFRLNTSMKEIEGQLPPDSYLTAYSAVRERFGEPPADYESVYCYHAHPETVKNRFREELGKGKPNVFILQADPFLHLYGKELSLGHIFVDLWNLTDWYAKDFTTYLKGVIDGLLS